MTGFFRGMLPRVLYSMPATAICWSTYEFFKYIIERRGQEALIVPKVPPSPKDVFAIVPAVGATAFTPTPVTPVVVAPSSPPPSPPTGSGAVDTTVLKARELPAMSGAGMYGALQYNTMHQQQTSTVPVTMRGN